MVPFLFHFFTEILTPQGKSGHRYYAVSLKVFLKAFSVIENHRITTGRAVLSSGDVSPIRLASLLYLRAGGRSNYFSLQLTPKQHSHKTLQNQHIQIWSRPWIITKANVIGIRNFGLAS